MTNDQEEWTDWIEHDGSGQPVPDYVFVQVHEGDGEIDEAEAIYFCWCHGECRCNPFGSISPEGEIIRYRIKIPRALQHLRQIAEHPEQERETV